mgnify:CR=1 FL=1
MEIPRLKNLIVRYQPALLVGLFLGLAGCQTQPALETSQYWSRADNGSYVNNATGVVISRSEYGKRVAAEAYYSLSARGGDKNYCPR